MFDVFYFGPKPNLFVFEKSAESLDDAARQCKTEYYWYIYGNVDTASIDFSYVPLPWENTHVHVWPSQWHNYGGVYLANKYTVHERQWQFHSQVIKTNPTRENWIVNFPIYEDRFDWAWVPHPMDPPYVYVFGNQWYPPERMPTVEYHVPGATECKYMDIQAYLAPCTANWQLNTHLATDSIDFTWVPDPQDPPYIYEFGTQWQPNGGAEYRVPRATERKYVDSAHRRLTDDTNWTTPFPVEKFDYSWHSDNTEEPYIYEFATQWQPNGGPVYHVPGATKIKYIDIPARRLPIEDNNWEVLESCEFDFSWHPSNTEEPYIYVFGNQHYPGNIMSTVRYVVPGATQEKFVDTPVARLAESRQNWQILERIDETAWDWTWVPNPKDPPYIYEFGNQWNPAEYKASVRYTVPGATEVKYMEPRTQRLPHPELFRFNIAVADFDYSWEPNPFDPPFTYVFGNQWNPAVLESTVVYTVAGATETKYIDDLVARVAQDLTNWEILDEIKTFDYSWRPNPTDPPYIYVFGNQWLTPEQRPAVRYRVPSGTQLKYIDEPKAQRVGNPELFVTHADSEFDYSWEPDPGSPPYNYVFGNQWWPAEVMPTVEYRMTNATETKFMTEPVAQLTATEDHWITLFECEFDRSWCPDPGSPPYIYVFGNQWYPAEVMPTAEYHMPGATERKYVDYHKAQLTPIMDRWAVPEEVDVTNIDFTWHPHPKDAAYIHHFGTEHQMSIGLTYTVPGATELKFEGDIPRITKEKRAVDVLDIFYVDRSNPAAGVRFDRLKERYPNIQKIRYANSMMATIQRCVARARTTKFWVISSEYSYVNFDFTWHAQPWQSYMTHVFPSQHNKWSDTFLINRWEFERHAKWADGLEQFPNLNFVTNQTVARPENLDNIYYVDHGNPESADQFALLQREFPEITRTRFVDNYLDVMKRIMSTAETEYVWILNSICNYDFFDFTWKPEPWQAEMIHCFSSGLQKRGDTFYIHVSSFKKQMVDLDLLDWFNVINYIDTATVDRFDTPVHYYTSDDLITEIKNYKFETPYVMFTNQPTLLFPSAICLWTEKDRVVERCSISGATAIVPRDIKKHLKSQIYDYPYLAESVFRVNEYYNNKNFPQLDIIFVSNGEIEEQRCFDHLQYASNTEVTWIRGINGRTAALHAAALASTTPWFFCVPGKLHVKLDFNWFWLPDYWQGPKHYIFQAHNPVNGLEYGHQALVCYNKNLVLATTDPGLDFTMSQPTETVPILSGTAVFNTDAWQTWRTAFREVVKLMHFNATEPTLETEHRLNIWLTQAQGPFAEDCLQGALDAKAYYTSVNGNYDLLKLSYDWAWLKEFYNNKYQTAISARIAE